MLSAFKIKKIKPFSMIYLTRNKAFPFMLKGERELINGIV